MIGQGLMRRNLPSAKQFQERCEAVFRSELRKIMRQAGLRRHEKLNHSTAPCVFSDAQRSL